MDDLYVQTIIEALEEDDMELTEAFINKIVKKRIEDKLPRKLTLFVSDKVLVPEDIIDYALKRDISIQVTKGESDG